MNHPLTDVRIYDEIISLELPSINDDIRAAYDKGAADRLEQVIEYLENNLEFALDWSDTFMDRFKKAMRPQEES